MIIYLPLHWSWEVPSKPQGKGTTLDDALGAEEVVDDKTSLENVVIKELLEGVSGDDVEALKSLE
jgi:hypothetical protein